MLVHLTLDDLDWVYEKLLETFPKEEVKPKAWLKAMLEKGDYRLYAYKGEGSFLALALCYQKTSPALLDYFLVEKTTRGKGIGSRFLTLLEQEPTFRGGFIVEAEALSFAKDEASYLKRLRRITFYKRLGYQETTLMPTIFGCTYTLFLSKVVPLDEESLRTTYHTIYRAMVPKDLHEENILIP